MLQGEALASWNLSLTYEAEGDLSKAVAFSDVYRRYQREIGLALSKEDAARIERLREYSEGATQPH